MLPQLSKIKGVHPGDLLRRELKIEGLKASQLAISIGEHKQTISAILNKRRAVNPKLSIKLSRQFNVDEDYFMMLQSSYDVKIASELEMKRTPNLDKIRKVIFWDTTFDKIDWDKNKRAIIKRVLERGNDLEIREIISFYSKGVVSYEVKSMTKSYLSSFEENVVEYKLK